MTNEHIQVPEAPERRPYGFLVAAAFCIAGLVALGTWQLNRLSEKETLIADRKAMQALPPLDLSRETPPERVTYRRVSVRGKFRHQKSLRIGPKPRQGRVGWQVITPLERSDGAPVIFVDRGWMADDRNDGKNQLNQQASNSVNLTGFIKTVGKRGAFVPDNDPVKGDWYWIDPTAMGRHLGLSNVAPYWVVADGAPIAMPPNNHLQYALTWYSLAAALAILAMVYWRRPSPQA